MPTITVERVNMPPVSAPQMNEMGFTAFYDSYHKTVIEGLGDFSESARVNYVHPGCKRVFTEMTLSYFNEKGEYEGEAWEFSWEEKGRQEAKGVFVDVRYDKLAQVAAKYPKNAIVCYDIWENLPDKRADKHEIERRIRRMRRVISITQSVRPDIIIGYYVSAFNWHKISIYYHYLNVLEGKRTDPNRDWLIGSNKTWSSELQIELDAFDRLDYGLDQYGNKIKSEGLLDALHILTPSLYTIYGVENTTDELDLYNDSTVISGTIQNLIKYKKPIIPYFHPYSHDGNMKGGLRMSDKRIENMFLSARNAGASGGILWGHGVYDSYVRNAFEIGCDVFGRYVPPVK